MCVEGQKAQLGGKGGQAQKNREGTCIMNGQVHLSKHATWENYLNEERCV